MKRYVAREAALAIVAIGAGVVPPGSLKAWKRIYRQRPGHGRYWMVRGAKKHWAARLGERWHGERP